MNTNEITQLLTSLDAGSITWEEALKSVTALPTAWQTAEWKKQRALLIKDNCQLCHTTTGPFVLQHLTHYDTYAAVCQQVKAEYRARALQYTTIHLTEQEVADHVGPGEKRSACPTCGSINIRERRTLYPPFICAKCEKNRHPMPWFEQPLATRYYAKQQTTNRAEALRAARGFLISYTAERSLSEHYQAICHEATRRCLIQSLAYRSLENTATYCKKCAFKEDLPLIKRKATAF